MTLWARSVIFWNWTSFTLSKTRNASLISSSLSVSFIFLAIMVRNSGKSIVPFPKQKAREFKQNPNFYQSLGLRMRVVILTISIHFIDHVLKLSLCWVLSEWAHDSAQLFGCDGAVAILVKEWESLFEFCEGWQMNGIRYCINRVSKDKHLTHRGTSGASSKEGMPKYTLHTCFQNKLFQILMQKKPELNHRAF